MHIKQTTIATETTISGVGLHTGSIITMRLRPAGVDTGVVFYRTEGDRRVAIEAKSKNVVDTTMATVLGKDGVSVSTVEHFLAALVSVGIDNLNVDIDGPEIPIMDGSAAPFIVHLSEVGVRAQDKGRTFLSIRKPVTFLDGEKRIRVIPSRFFRVSFELAYDHPSISVQRRSFKFNSEKFTDEISSARTFGFLHEVEYLKSKGLALGGSLDNAVVLDQEKVLNPEGLRYSDEFVRHKILDCVGDFSLIGYPILGHVKAYRSGHDANHQLVEKILADPDCYQLIELGEQEIRETVGQGVAAAIGFTGA